AADRVLADSDENLERLFDGRHVRAATAVTVEQTIDGKLYANHSDPREPFQMDFFPRNLLHAANHFARKAAGGEIYEWLGMTATAAPGGVLVTSVVQKFDPDELMKQYDRPPLDGVITQ